MRHGRAILAGLAFSFANSVALGQSPAVVAVLTSIEHPTLDAVRDGLRDALKDRGYVDGDNLVLMYESAQADAEIASEIARGFVAQSPDVAVAISAPAAEALVPVGEQMPLVITALGPDRAAEIVNGGNIAGLVQPPPHRQQLDIVEAIAPGTKSLIIPYTAPETLDNISRPFRRAAQELGMSITTVELTDEAEFEAQLDPHLSEQATIFLFRDSAIENSIEMLVELAVEKQVPIFAAFEEAVTRGALATVDYDPYDVGRQTAIKVLEILAGQSPVSLGLEEARPTRVVLNEDTAERIGLAIPSELRERARFIVEAPFDRPAQQGAPRPVPPPCDGTARCQ